MLRTRSIFIPMVVIGALVSAARQSTASTIDTLTGWNYSDHVQWFGRPQTQTFGQTVTVGSDNMLQSFEFELQLQSGNDPTTSYFQGYVMAWDNSSSVAIGGVLYQSPVVRMANVGDWESFVFNTDGLALTSGQQYVLFLNVSNNPGPDDSIRMATNQGSDTYLGGLFVFANNTDFSQLTHSSWTENWQGPGYDTAFRAVFSPVPEPSTFVFLGIGAVGLLSCIWRRRRKLRALGPVILAATVVLAAGVAQADVFNMPSGQTCLSFVPVGELH